MYKVMQVNGYKYEEAICISDEFLTEIAAYEWISDHYSHEDSIHFWVEDMTGQDVLMDGWDNDEQEDMWSMLN